MLARFEMPPTSGLNAKSKMVKVGRAYGDYAAVNQYPVHLKHVCRRIRNMLKHIPHRNTIERGSSISDIAQVACFYVDTKFAGVSRCLRRDFYSGCVPTSGVSRLNKIPQRTANVKQSAWFSQKFYALQTCITAFKTKRTPTTV